MQRYHCFICHEDAIGGRSIVHGGMFFKICSSCCEDEDLYAELERKMMEEPIEETSESAKSVVEQ